MLEQWVIDQLNHVKGEKLVILPDLGERYLSTILYPGE